MRHISLSAIVILQLAACRNTSHPPVTPPATGSTERTLIDETPVVDIHAHTFNARFLPLRGIVLAKRYKLKQAAGLPDKKAIALADLITGMTPRESGIPAPSRAPSDRQIADSTNALFAAEGGRISPPLTAEDVGADPGIQGARKILAGNTEALEEDEKVALADFANLFSHGVEPPAVQGFLAGDPSSSSKGEALREGLHFVKCVIRGSMDLEQLYRSDHTARDGGNRRKIDLVASHMMDMAPSYDQKEDGERLYQFQSQQIPAIRGQQAEANGRMLYFVAYNPFRDHWSKDPAARDGHALEIVKDAVMNKGAFGVKVYPPSGYAPAGTWIPDAPSGGPGTQPLEQWRARYTRNGAPIDPAEIDRRLLKLALWCVDNDVPIFAHCGDNEMEAAQGYASFANPEGWKRLIEDNKAAYPRITRIRLCLGHAGARDWYGRFGTSGWGRTVFELCRDYPNIYCEFGCHPEIAAEGNRKNIARNIAGLVEESRRRKKDGSESYDFSEKIMYGSDWFMPMPTASNRLNYLLAFQTMACDAGTRADGSPDQLYKRFFHQNAMVFLNTRKRIDQGGLPSALVSNLERLSKKE